MDNFVVQLPHPAHFGLHKLIISPRRLRKEKAIKDRDAAIGVLRALIAHRQARTITDAFQSVPRKWQKTILEGLARTGEAEILALLKN